MGGQAGRDRILYTAIADGPTVTAAAEGLLCTEVNIQAHTLEVGTVLKATLFGRASSVITTPGSLTLRARWGPASTAFGSRTLLAATAAMTQMTASAQTNLSWLMEFFIVCRSRGAAGTVMTSGYVTRGGVLPSIDIDLFPASAAATAVVDTTSDGTLTITAEPQLASASITCHSFVLEKLN